MGNRKAEQSHGHEEDNDGGRVHYGIYSEEGKETHHHHGPESLSLSLSLPPPIF